MAKRVEWEAELENSRKDKDEFFSSGHPHSPIPLKERPKFKGLDYYPPNPAYRFELELYEHKNKEVIKVEATKGEIIDLEPEKDRTVEGKWILDFNVAYNPWCAYSEEYTCPLVPPENWLKVTMKVGEKDYPLKSKE